MDKLTHLQSSQVRKLRSTYQGTGALFIYNREEKRILINGFLKDHTRVENEKNELDYCGE